jgi:hypothetical protein
VDPDNVVEAVFGTLVITIFLLIGAFQLAILILDRRK